MKGKVYHIGRSNTSNELFIFNESVSTSHAQVFIDKNNDLIIIDLESKNGVLVNGDRIVSPVKLIPGDTVTLGSFRCTQKDLLHAIKIFDFKNTQSKLQSVHLKSSILQDNNIKKKRKININLNSSKNIWIWLLLIIAVVLLSIGIYSLNTQSDLENKYKKHKSDKSKTENIEKEEVEKEADNSSIIKKKKSRDKQRTDITYDYSCLITENDGGSNESLIVFGDLTRDVQNTILNDVEITVQEEEKAGDELIKELKKTKKFINSGSDIKKLNSIMKNLVSRIAKPRGFDYNIYLVEDTVLNVFTLGGHIVFHTRMFDFCKNDSELASIIAHEISHNELGHITLKLKKRKSAQDYGIFGEIIVIVDNILSTPFNQKQETEADLFGMDLMYPTNYQNCSAITLWKRMATKENEFNVVDNFIRSHPYSKSRANCIDHHLISNYNKHCE